MIITIEYRDLFGRWQPEADRTFESINEARRWCINASDVLGIAYRILVDGKPIDEVDLERGFFELGDLKRDEDQS